MFVVVCYSHSKSSDDLTFTTKCMIFRKAVKHVFFTTFIFLLEISQSLCAMCLGVGVTATIVRVKIKAQGINNFYN